MPIAFIEQTVKQVHWQSLMVCSWTKFAHKLCKASWGEGKKGIWSCALILTYYLLSPCWPCDPIRIYLQHFYLFIWSSPTIWAVLIK